jgi:hypothetical protein
VSSTRLTTPGRQKRWRNCPNGKKSDSELVAAAVYLPADQPVSAGGCGVLALGGPGDPAPAVAVHEEGQQLHSRGIERLKKEFEVNFLDGSMM